ncbi:MAG: TadE/TadG family type IV pilus assembly protein [Bryobacterales bacterium]|nr:pilus assembly protein [Bryobacteraceae bacterium]MDW8353407.1 TadE/TadG family type IV pilus assembly protein [Bryobacterales bacterium]
MVELSLVLVPTLALILAITDFAIAIFVRSALQHAVTEGVRYAITYRTIPGLSHSESIKQVVQQRALGFLAGASGLSKIRVRFYSQVTFTEATGPGANAAGNIVEVSVEDFSWSPIVPLWRSASPIVVRAAAADRLQSLPFGTPLPPP